MTANPDRVLADLRARAELSGNERGAQRVAWTDTWAAARAWERELLGALPVEVDVDEAGNQWATLRGSSPDTLIIGSHIDSVPDGGRLDGCLGVLAGLEVLRAVAAASRPPLTVKLVDWADEPGARLRMSLLGSSAAAGTLEPELLRSLPDAEGVTAEQALARHGVDVNAMPRAARRLQGATVSSSSALSRGRSSTRATFRSLSSRARTAPSGGPRDLTARHRSCRGDAREEDIDEADLVHAVTELDRLVASVLNRG